MELFQELQDIDTDSLTSIFFIALQIQRTSTFVYMIGAVPRT